MCSSLCLLNNPTDKMPHCLLAYTMTFVDDTVICNESREEVEAELERWRDALERKGMKVSRSKTDYLAINMREHGGVEVARVDKFKCNGEYGREVEMRVQTRWSGWRKVTAMLNGLETVPMTK